MTIPYLQGWGDNLAQALPQLGQGIAHIINPQLDQQIALKSAIMKDPSILREYASIERKNPGTLASMGFGKQFSSIIGSIQPTPEEALKEQQAASQAEALSTPEGKRAYGHKAVFGETESETSERNAQARLAESQKTAVDLGTRVTQANLDELERKNKVVSDLFKKIPDLSKVDINKLAADASVGKGDPTMLARIQADSTIGPVFEQLQKNLIERAKLAIEQGRLDVLKSSNKGQQFIAINEALKFQKEAEKRVQQLQLLTTKFGGMGKDQFGLAETMAQDRAKTGDTSMLDEINAYKDLKKNNMQDLIDAQKDAKKYRAVTLEVMKMNPDIKAAIDKLDKEDTSIKPDVAKSDPLVEQAIEYKNARGMKKLQERDLWKTLNPRQQAAVKFSGDTIPDRAGVDQTKKPKIKNPAGDTIPDRAGKDQIEDPYKRLLQDLQDTLNNRPIGTGRLPITSPNFDTPVSGADSGKLAGMGFKPTRNPVIK